jgi:lipoprotein-anchoring transpeptidase ErfK/SrfK
VTTDLTSTIVQVKEALRAGEKDLARSLLQDAARSHPQDHRIWLWLAALAKTPQESLDYVSQAESIAPLDEKVIEAKAWAESQRATDVVAEDRPGPVADPVAESPAVAATTDKPKPADKKSDKAFFRLATCLSITLILIVTTLVMAALGWNVLRPQQENNLLGQSGGTINTEPHRNETVLVEVSVDAPTISPTPTSVPTEVPPPTDASLSVNLVRAKKVLVSEGEARLTWTPTPRPTITPSPTPTPIPTFVSNPSDTGQFPPLGLAPGEKWIDVDISTQTLVAYEGTIPVFDSLVSTGTTEHPTVTGQFRIWLRFRSQDMDGYRLGYDYFLRNVPFVQYFYYDYSLHGTFWHNNFGNPMSHGCVNLPTPVSEWLFNWAEYGTLVNIHI